MKYQRHTNNRGAISATFLFFALLSLAAGAFLSGRQTQTTRSRANEPQSTSTTLIRQLADRETPTITGTIQVLSCAQPNADVTVSICEQDRPDGLASKNCIGPSQVVHLGVTPMDNTVWFKSHIGNVYTYEYLMTQGPSSKPLISGAYYVLPFSIAQIQNSTNSVIDRLSIERNQQVTAYLGNTVINWTVDIREITCGDITPSPKNAPTITPPTATPTREATQSCTYNSHVTVKNESNQILSISDFNNPNEWYITNNKGQRVNFPSSSNNDAEIDVPVPNLTFSCTDQEAQNVNNHCSPTAKYRRGEEASLTLHTDNEYEIVNGMIPRCGSKYNRADFSCPTYPQKTPNLLEGMLVDCDMEVQSVWYVKKKPTIVDSCTLKTKATCKPQNVHVVTKETAKNRVLIQWDSPRDCVEFDTTKNRYWVDVIDTRDNKIVCSTSSGDDNEAGCNPGKNRERQIDKQITTWESNVSYRVSVYAQNGVAGCVNSANTKFTYKPEKPTDKPAKPTNPPIPTVSEGVTPPPSSDICSASGASCRDRYQEDCTRNGNPGKKWCNKIGICSARGDGTKCSWGPGSSCEQCISNTTPPPPGKPIETPRPGQSPAPQPTSPPAPRQFETCHHISGNGNIDVVFLAENFEDSPAGLVSYIQTAERLVNTLTNTNLGSRVNQFNFIAYTPMGAQYTNSGTYFEQGTVNMHASASTCGQDRPLTKIPVTVRRGSMSSVGEGFGTIGFGGVVAVSSDSLATSPPTFAHELGHIFGMNDEYVKLNPDPDDPRANCSTEATCSKWGNKGECIKGCYQAEWYRPSFQSVMNTGFGGGPVISWQGRTNTFNRPSLDRWDKSAGGSADRFNPQSVQNSTTQHVALKMTLRQDQDKSLTLSHLAIDNVYPQNYASIPFSDYYTVLLLDKKNTSTFTGYIANEDNVMDLVDDSNSQKIKDELTLFVPFDSKASQLKITDTQNNEKLAINLADYKLKAPTQKENLCGNGLCDAGLGENANSCRVDCVEGQSVLDKLLQLSRADVNHDGVISTSDVTATLINYGKSGKNVTGDINADGKINILDFYFIYENLDKTI